VGQQVLGDILDLMELGGSLLQIPGVPEDDGTDDQFQAEGTVLLTLVGAVTDFTQPVGEHRACQAVTGLTLVEFLAGRASQVTDPIVREQSTLPVL
jgi:hypothetical protein